MPFMKIISESVQNNPHQLHIEDHGAGSKTASGYPAHYSNTKA
jgi:hypothetical protein